MRTFAIDGRLAALLLIAALLVAAVLLTMRTVLGPRLQAAKERDFAVERDAMVDHIRLRYGVQSEPVLEAMRRTERHLFVPETLRGQAYSDRPLPIGEGQTISAPGIVAKMTELLEPRPHHRILEVGTGSGYQAAVLAPLVDHVYTIEIVPSLADSARATLEGLGYTNVTVRCGDGYRGWPEHAPFDGIIVTCAPDEVPEPLKEQLADGGRMVIPVGPEGDLQWLYVLTKRGGVIESTARLPVAFVPMTGEARRRSRSPLR